jgi:hypothetical protein
MFTGKNLSVLLQDILTFDKDIQKDAEDNSPSHRVCIVPAVWAEVCIWISRNL